MRVALFGMLLLFVTACGTSKNAETESSTTEEQTVDSSSDEPQINMKDEMVDYRAEGVIIDKSSEDGCGFVIQANIEGSTQLLDPGFLSDEFKVDGLEVRITYAMSRKQVTCPGTAPIILNGISKK